MLHHDLGEKKLGNVFEIEASLARNLRRTRSQRTGGMRNKERSGDGGMRVISIDILALGGNNDELPKASPAVFCVYIFLSSLYRWGVV